MTLTAKFANCYGFWHRVDGNAGNRLPGYWSLERGHDWSVVMLPKYKTNWISHFFFFILSFFLSFFAHYINYNNPSSSFIMSNIETLEDEVAITTSVHQIRADSTILGPMNKLLGTFSIYSLFSFFLANLSLVANRGEIRKSQFQLLFCCWLFFERTGHSCTSLPRNTSQLHHLQNVIWKFLTFAFLGFFWISH